SCAVQTPPPASLAESPASFTAGQGVSTTVSATWSAIFAPTATDWIAIYRVGTADNTFLAWRYTDGTAAGSAPLAVPANAPAGTYELRLFSNNVYTLLATSNSFTLQTPAPASLSAGPPTLNPRQPVTATWSSIFAPTSTDWIALYVAGAADNAFIAWRYTDGNAAGSAPLTIPANAAPGTYELRLFSNNVYTLLATSNRFSIGSSSAMKLHFIHVDHLDTPRMIADASATTVWKWDQQEPFGNSVADENPSGLGAFDLPLRLPGQYFDKETNLHYNYFRHYDPGTGGYKQSDPLGLIAGLN